MFRGRGDWSCVLIVLPAPGCGYFSDGLQTLLLQLLGLRLSSAPALPSHSSVSGGEALTMSWAPPPPHFLPIANSVQVHWPLCTPSGQINVPHGLWHRPSLPLEGSSPDTHTDNFLTSYTSLFKCHFLSKAFPHLNLQTLNLCGCVYRFLWYFQTYHIITYYSVYCSLSVSPNYSVRFLRRRLCFFLFSIYLNKQMKYQNQVTQFSYSLPPTSSNRSFVLYELGYLYVQVFLH